MLTTDINCDMGESTHLWPYDIENDIALLPWVSSINIACGFHAGDPFTMHELVAAATEAEIAIGAHVSFMDRDNFGRSNMNLSPEQVYDLVVYQIGALQAFLKLYDATLHHVKPHGALYNMAAADPALADTICRAIKNTDNNMILYGLSGSELITRANAVKLISYSEVFADRTYRDDGSLTPRTEANALIEDEAACIKQVLQMVQQDTVTTTSGKKIPMEAETVCIHSDGAHALAFAKKINQALKKQGIEISA
ncbi:LamB/YcsF family protein [Paraflavitalea soli]|uniref:LamB/YcsF family protein n=1 Tax=Paraflavitalea soli TaxID=2315862 RepID=A0A3B7MJ62_9BACT|nr:5-oxoprolinase subunit PxpA [Paraflavitalea soli]AXY74494.1 LamB/YcsF family protein [Paraflavitalea soli]